MFCFLFCTFINDIRAQKKKNKIFAILKPKMDERVEQLFYIFPLKIVFFKEIY